MSPPQYRFLSWVRDGLSAAIGKPEEVGSPAGPASSELTSTVSLNEQPLRAPDLTMIGPRDVTGFHRAQIVRMYPRPGVTDAETTMFPLIEFDRPDLPWLVTPRQAGDARLRPWLCLVVVEVGHPDVHFERLPGVDHELLVAPAAELPAPASLYLWAHAQLLVDGDSSTEEVLRDEPRSTLSRLICPRLLAPFTAYRACVVPAFKVTVQATFGESPGDDLSPAWADDDPEVRLPVFASWPFSTGEAGGFEELVDRLQGRPLPDGVGVRTLDVSHGGPGLKSDGDNATTKVESALRAPDAQREDWPKDPGARHFRDELAERVAPGALSPEAELEPVVAPPLYGSAPWHHTTVDPDPKSTLWVDQLNADPRERVAAALGTTAVQREQEQLMERAWEQLAAHQEAERERQWVIFAREVGGSLFRRHLEKLADERAFSLTAPAHGRLPGADPGATVTGAVVQSALPSAADGMPFRRALRVRGEVATRVARITGEGEPFAGRLEGIATTGLAVSYRTPDGILGLLDDPRDLFEGAARERVVQVFADNRIDDLAVLTDSIAANAGFVSMSADQLAALDAPAELGADLQLAELPELAQVRVRVEEDGVAEQLVTQGFALKLPDGVIFAAPQDEQGAFLPVAIQQDRIEVLTQIVKPDDSPHLLPFVLVGQERGGELRTVPFAATTQGPAIDALLSARTAVTLAGPTFADATGQIHVTPRPRPGLLEAGLALGWRGAASHSIGELSLSSELVKQARAVDAVGVRDALLKWGGDQEVTVVAAPDAKLDALAPIVGIRPKSVVDGVIVSASGASRGVAEREARQRPAFDLAANAKAARAALKPEVALGLYLQSRLGIEGSRVLEPPTWAPAFPDPMWEALGAISKDWILAGLDRIPPNTVTLAESNDRFIEAYLVGLNHELGRELVWREFPTDRRGTCFQSFWGVKVPVPGSTSPTQVPEIERLAAQAWREGSLGTHKPAAAGIGEQLVLVVRGDLLRRYPGTIVFAVPDEDGHADFASDRVKQPIFGGPLGEETRFFGFDLTEEIALAEGWWFVFAEQPTERRFGLNSADGDWGEPQPYAAPALPEDTPAEIRAATVWNDASWSNAVASSEYEAGMHVPMRAGRLVLPPGPNGGPPLDPAVWGAHAADVARITFQQPVRASVSARKMLQVDEADG